MTVPFVYNDRFDPFSGSEEPSGVLSEDYVIPSTSPYWVQLDEIPYESYGITISGYSEVSGTPGANQFRVDWTYKTGLIEFHSSDAGNSITVAYKGLGSPVVAERINNIVSRDPLDAWRSGVWAYEELVDDFCEAGGPNVNFGRRPDRWALPSVVTNIMQQASNTHIMRGLASNLVTNRGLFSLLQYKGQAQGPIVVTGRFKLSNDTYTRSQIELRWGFGSWNGAGTVGMSFAPNFCWTLGAAQNTVAFETSGGIVLDNIPTSWTWMREYTIAFTPGLVELFIDRTLVGTTSSFVASTQPGCFGMFISNGGSSWTVQLHTDYVGVRMLGPGLQP